MSKDLMSRDCGVTVAALTPRGKRGELNYGACFELLDHLCKAKVRAIALLTASGEYPAFTFEERTRLVYLGAKRSRAPLLAGVGAEDLGTALALAREAMSAGAEGVLLPPPLLIPYPPEELREYYLQFAGNAGAETPVWIVPEPSMPPATAAALLETGRFAGVVGEGLRVSTAACAIPELHVALERAVRAGDEDRANALAGRTREFEDWSAHFAPLVAVKMAVELRGIPMGSLPVPVAPERQHAIDEFRAWFRAWLPASNEMAANA